MRISDWSSDVCSSDLIAANDLERAVNLVPIITLRQGMRVQIRPTQDWYIRRLEAGPPTAVAESGKPDRKSVVSGKSVAVRVDLGGRRIIKKKKIIYNQSSKKTCTSIMNKTHTE